MRKHLFLYTAIIIFIGLFCFFVASIYVTYNNNMNFAKDTVAEITQICANQYNADADISSFVKSGSDTRITVIAPDGTVLADSKPLDTSEMENHLNRPEIQAAESGSPEAHIRRSDSLGVDFIYYALKVESGGSYVFIRTAIPIAKVDSYVSKLSPLLLFLLLVIALLCFFSVHNMISRIIQPLSSVEKKLRLLATGDGSAEPIGGSYEEINEIMQGIDEVALVLQTGVNDLRDEKNKLDYIINNINDGIFAVDENKDIALINAAAIDIFNVNFDIEGKNLNYLTYDKTIGDAVNDCIGYNKNALFEVALNGRIFFAAVKRLPETKLTMLVLSDVTESRENAKQREEFFANASHELKTPLTAIKGFNELTAINNKDESIDKYIGSITRETDRMLTLIGDMLKLSELEIKRDINPVPVSLAKVANEAKDVLSAGINEKSIQFEITGDAEIKAEQEHIYEVVKNLIENAIRYNNHGGKVSIIITGNKKTAQLTISDNGIGIPPEEQARIFERFYRVEKSRCLRNGGTGLGLSIVKHICALYDWKLSLKSKLGVGTEITIIFSAQK